MPKPYFFETAVRSEKFPECSYGSTPKRIDLLAENIRRVAVKEELLNKNERTNLENKHDLEQINRLFEALASSQQPYQNAFVPETEPESSSILTIERLSELPYIEEDDDYTRPTQYAFSSANQLIIQTRDILHGVLPDAFLMTTEKGGVEFYWKKQNLSLKLTVASSPIGTDYIYIREDGQSSVDKTVSPKALANWLREYIRRN